VVTCHHRHIQSCAYVAASRVVRRRNEAVIVQGRQRVGRSIARDIQMPNRGGTCKSAVQSTVMTSSDSTSFIWLIAIRSLTH